MTAATKKHGFTRDTDSLIKRLIIRLLVDHGKETCNEWQEQSCPDVEYNGPGQAFLAWEDILLSGLEKDVSQEVYGALFAVYLVFGIAGYDSFSEYVQQTVQLGLRRWEKAFSVDSIQLTGEQIELLEEMLSFAQILSPNKSLFLFFNCGKEKNQMDLKRLKKHMMTIWNTKWRACNERLEKFSRK